MDEISERQQKIYDVGIYARLSVDNHNAKNESIETQIDIAKAYIKDKSEFELYQCYIDLGMSGAHFKRDGFKHLMEDVKQRKVNCIIIKDFSRLGRNYIETGNFIQKIFPFLGVRFISVTDGFDSNYAQSDAFSMNLKNLVNDMYARDVAAKLKSTRISQKENGSYMGGVAPYGYRISKIDGKRVLVIEEEAAVIVKTLFHQYETQNSYKKLIQWLYENKIHRPTEYQKYKHVYCIENELLFEWSRWSIKSILTNPVYMGCLIDDVNYKQNSLLENHSDNIYINNFIKENTHQAIIDSKQFLKIAHQLEKHSQSKNNGKNKDTQLIAKKIPLKDDIFEGIFFCGDCHCKMKRITLIKNVKRDKKRRYLYDCSNSEKIDSRKCCSHVVSLEKLEEIVRESLKKEYLLSNIQLWKMMEYLQNQIQFHQNLLQKMKEKCERKVQNCKKRQSEQYLKYQSNKICLQIFEKMRRESQQQLACLSNEFEEIQHRQKDYEMIAAECKNALAWFLQWHSLNPLDETEQWELSDKLKYIFIHELIEKIYIFSDKRIEIIFCFQEGESKEWISIER